MSGSGFSCETMEVLSDVASEFAPGPGVKLTLGSTPWEGLLGPWPSPPHFFPLRLRLEMPVLSPWAPCRPGREDPGRQLDAHS